ncbi:MAG: hypothetical protein QM648_05955 [Solirubrobacterales bacterium]
MEDSPQQSRALESASPRRLWLWAVVIALVGVVLRVLWFQRYRDELMLGYGWSGSPHYWALSPRVTGGIVGDFNPLLAAKAFAPGYGLFLRGVNGIDSTHDAIVLSIFIAQTAMLFLATLLTFALSRRVIFGWAALVPAVLLTASIALLELPGGMAPWIPVMLLVVTAIWLLTNLRERLLEERSGAPEMFITVAAGLTIGGAILFNPGVLLLALPICWWAFRGIGREHAILLLVAVILLPACWLAVVQSQVTGGIPADQLTAWFQADAGNAPQSLSQAADHAYAVATPWNPRFARSEWSSMNANYEWLLPFSIRADTSYQSATRILAAVWMVGYVLLILAGIVALFVEGAGSSARLIGMAAITLPLITFFSAWGNLVRVPALPFLMIALVLGAIWAIERLRTDRSNT